MMWRFIYFALGLLLAVSACNSASDKVPAATAEQDAAGVETEATETIVATDTPETSTEPPADAALHDTWSRPADGMTMVFVPAGSFAMGSDERGEDEAPQHEVSLDGFWFDQTEVTNAMYESCIADGPCQPTIFAAEANLTQAEQPIVGVSWDHAVEYCAWAEAQLPTEAQWEYAARGPESHLYPWGNTPLPNDTLVNFDRNVGAPAPVGSYPEGASWIGAFDMAGNVEEWVDDWFDAYPGNEAPGFQMGTTHRVSRGGGWNDFAPEVSPTERTRSLPEVRQQHLGFRCASPGS